MNLGSNTIHDIIHPTAAFSNRQIPGGLVGEAPGKQDSPKATWESSQLNPKNRIDSLDVPKSPLWRIDGCTGLGTQFYSIPLFLSSANPLRVDVFVPEHSTQSQEIRDLLDLDVTFHTKDRSRVSILGISRHIVRTLQLWTNRLPDPTDFYNRLPFGSRIVFENLSINIKDIKITVAPTYYLERQLLSSASLESLWGPGIDLPPSVDITEVRLVQQLHDSVCSVQINGEIWIFKALTSFTKYLYHELKQLLSAKPHPNIVSRPAHLITKKCTFGNKIAVLGFTLEYHESGTMRDIIPFLQMHNMLQLTDQFKWSIQIANAVTHHRETSGTFYPDLRLDNIVLSKEREVIMVDFEQRGVWCEFASPEVNAIEYIRLLAVDEDIPDDTRERFACIMRGLCPDFETLLGREEYTNPDGGYNPCWLSLSPREQEAAEVYMLGRVLWCFFEGVSAPQKAAVWQSYRWESDVEFPAYRRTPPALQQLIDQCTRGRRHMLSSKVVRERNKLMIAGSSKPSNVKDIIQAARDWWVAEIAASEAFLAKRSKLKGSGEWKDNYFDRPSLREVIQSLKSIRAEMGVPEHGMDGWVDD